MEQVSVSDPFIAPEESNDDFKCDDTGDCNAVSVDSVLLSERHVQRVIELLIPGIYFILLGIRYIETERSNPDYFKSRIHRPYGDPPVCAAKNITS